MFLQLFVVQTDVQVNRDANAQFGNECGDDCVYREIAVIDRDREIL